MTSKQPKHVLPTWLWDQGIQWRIISLLVEEEEEIGKDGGREQEQGKQEQGGEQGEQEGEQEQGEGEEQREQGEQGGEQEQGEELEQGQGEEHDQWEAEEKREKEQEKKEKEKERKKEEKGEKETEPNNTSHSNMLRSMLLLKRLPNLKVTLKIFKTRSPSIINEKIKQFKSLTK